MAEKKFEIKDGKLQILEKKHVNEAAVLRYANAKKNDSEIDEMDKILDGIETIIRRIKRKELKLYDESDDEEGERKKKALELMKRVLEMLNKEQKINVFFDEKSAAKEDEERKGLLDMISMCPAEKLSALKNAMKNY